MMPQRSEALIAGFKCENEWVFAGVLVVAVIIVLLQNFIATNDQQEGFTLPKNPRRETK